MGDTEEPGGQLQKSARGHGTKGVGEKTRRVDSICGETLVRTRKWRKYSSLGIERTPLMTEPGF